MSLPGANNAIYRAIAALYYRPLKQEEKNRIWVYFESRCAYCDKYMTRESRYGHMDHLEAAAGSGGNYIRNRVLACKECNGNEKRELHWEQFLKSKCTTNDEFVARRDKILRWQAQFPGLEKIVLSSEAELARMDLDDAIRTFQDKFCRFRDLLYAAKRH
jgi:hypothetical protein